MQHRGNFDMSEDCLDVNVIRPSDQSSKSLPVLSGYLAGDSILAPQPIPRITVLELNKSARI